MGRRATSVLPVGLALAAGFWAACATNSDDELRQGGDTTVDDRSSLAFLHSSPALTMADAEQFQNGTSPFDFHWEPPQLGPLYNNDSCFGCHSQNGRGMAQIGSAGAEIDINGPQSQSLVRTSLLMGSADPTFPTGPIPVPGYGTQLHDHATTGLPQVVINLSWVEHDVTYGDGTTLTLRAPSLDIKAADNSALPDGMLFSYRIAPPLIGVGLLFAVDPSKDVPPTGPNAAGVHGVMNMVWDPTQMATVPGRLGWKANTATIELQAALAGQNDMGLSTSIFPDSDGTHDIADDQFTAMVFFLNTIAVPQAADRDATATQGRELFDSFGCSDCHTVTQHTGSAAIEGIANQEIHPYTDLLIHDMGSGLADGRPDYEASGSQWRTPALWGIGLAQTVTANVTFMHDGRARTFEEAIMWHGGEAQAAHDNFAAASASDRAALVAFLGTL